MPNSLLPCVGGLIFLAAWTGHSQPANDHFTNRIVLASTPAFFEGSIQMATAEPGEPVGAFRAATRSLWWTWTAPENGVADLMLSTDGFAAMVKVYTGDVLTNLTFVQAGAGCCNIASYAVWGTTPGQTYQITVDSYQGGFGEFTAAIYFHLRPPNDDFENRLLLPPMTNVVTTSNTYLSTAAKESNQYASAEPGEPALEPPGSRPAGQSLWWSWIAPERGLAKLRITSSNNTFLATRLLTGNSISKLAPAASTVTSITTWMKEYELQVGQGNRYEIIADRQEGSFPGEIGVVVTEIRSPPNDDFIERLLVSGYNLVLTGRLEAASNEMGEPFHGATALQRQSVWWGWTPTVSGNATLTITSQEYPSLSQPRFAIYTGDTVTGLTLVTNGGLTLASRVTLMVSAGVQYQIAVAGGTTPRMFSLAIDRGSPPVISWLHPSGDLAVPQGADVSFDAIASDADGPIERVEIFGAGQASPPLLAPPYHFVLTNVWYGTHRITARATDVDGLQTSIMFFLDVPQANDNFADRWQITGLPATVYGTNAGATTEIGEPIHANTTGFGSVWWTWRPSQSGAVVVATRTLGLIPPLLGVYTGSAVNALSVVGASDPYLLGGANGFAVFDAIADTSYHIAVDSRTSSGFFFSLSVLPLPANDHFTNRTRIVGNSFSASGYNYGATVETGEPRTSAQTNRSVWWSWTAPFTQRVTLTQSNNFRSEIAVYTGANVTNLTSIAKGTFCCGHGPTMELDVVQGVEYQIAVNNWGTDFGGDIAFNVRPTAVPALTEPAIAGGQHSFVLTGIPGRMHRIESSSNLVDWVPVQTVTLTTNTYPFDTPLLPGPGQVFYRAVLLP